MESNRRRPIGTELYKRGIITENDIDNATAYQRQNPDLKIGEIFYKLNICSAKQILDVLSDITGEKTIVLTKETLKIPTSKYLPIEYIKNNKVMPFDIKDNVVKVAFGDGSKKEIIDEVESILQSKGYELEKYITLGILINEVLNTNITQNARKIEIKSDVAKVIDDIILDAMKKRASDIHIEPLLEGIRIRMRIDGVLLVYGIIDNEYKQQIIGRLKAISNMFQEKQESQDGRITKFPDYNIRVSSQKNIYGEKFVLRLLKKNADVIDLGELGYPSDEKFVKKYFKKVNGLTILTAPTGEGKTTTLYSLIKQLNSSNINITTIEDPVEIRIDGLNQIEVSENVSFSDSLRTVLRQDPEIILVGEIRDGETAQIAVDSAHTGHYVLSTLHTISAIEAITRLRKLGLSNYDIAGTVGTIVSQRLVRRLCDCAKEREFTKEEIEIMDRYNKVFGAGLEYEGKKTYSPCGCDKCNGTGYFDRIAIYEIVLFDDNLKDLINNGESTLKIREYLLQTGDYKPIQVEGVQKVLKGITTFDELSKKINLNI
ncbi:MAG: type II/IV secretion system protein [Clostridiales bacterium]|nr:type II/IV secretion system protein [Clostridiales bacterium]